MYSCTCFRFLLCFSCLIFIVFLLICIMYKYLQRFSDFFFMFGVGVLFLLVVLFLILLVILPLDIDVWNYFAIFLT